MGGAEGDYTTDQVIADLVEKKKITVLKEVVNLRVHVAYCYIPM